MVKIQYEKHKESIAQHFYEKNNFVKEGVTRSYYVEAQKGKKMEKDTKN